jgi:hypothetical protein
MIGGILTDTDLAGANLRGAILSGADLCGAILSGADLHRADLCGAILCGADLHRANLSRTDLHRAGLGRTDLHHADLSNANLRGAILCGANLRNANLRGASLSRTDLSNANLRGASLSYAILRGAILHRVDLGDADLREAMLIDSRLDGANLTGVKLWETQRGGWSIKSVTCRRAFWDRDGKEPTEYGDGDFERIFAEKPRIVLRYPGGMSPVDLAMLPLIIERLQAEHPDCTLQIRSVQDDGRGATVTITVDDRAGRSADAFAQDAEGLRDDLAAVQQRLQQEERLRLEFEAGYKALVRDVLPMLMKRALPKTEVNIGQITGPTSIEGTTMSGDTYNIPGQAGAVGPGAHAHDNTFQQIQGAIHLPKLAEELGCLRIAMKSEATGTREQDKAIGAVADAEEAATKGDGSAALGYLKTAGKWTLGIAEKIGVAVAAEAIKRTM